MVNKINPLGSKPSLNQLLQQGILEPKIIEVTLDNSTQYPLEKSYYASSKLRPQLPNENDWISLEGLTPDDIMSLNKLFYSAQVDGIVFKKDRTGSIHVVDSSKIEGYTVGWGWMNIDGLDLTVAEKAECKWDGIPPVGALNKITGNRPPETIEEILQRNTKLPGLIKIGNKYIDDQPSEPIITTHIAFDTDTIFNSGGAYEEVRNNMQTRATTLLDGISKKSS